MKTGVSCSALLERKKTYNRVVPFDHDAYLHPDRFENIRQCGKPSEPQSKLPPTFPPLCTTHAVAYARQLHTYHAEMAEHFKQTAENLSRRPERQKYRI